MSPLVWGWGDLFPFKCQLSENSAIIQLIQLKDRIISFQKFSKIHLKRSILFKNCLQDTMQLSMVPLWLILFSDPSYKVRSIKR